MIKQETPTRRSLIRTPQTLIYLNEHEYNNIESFPDLYWIVCSQKLILNHFEHIQKTTSTERTGDHAFSSITDTTKRKKRMQ